MTHEADKRDDPIVPHELPSIQQFSFDFLTKRRLWLQAQTPEKVEGRLSSRLRPVEFYAPYPV